MTQPPDDLVERLIQAAEDVGVEIGRVNRQALCVLLGEAAKALRLSRREALEESAKLVESHRATEPETIAAIGLKQKLAQAIRALKEPKG